jgi:hypothetical protein
VKPFKISSAPVQILAEDLRKLHLATQAARFVRLFALYFAAHLIVPGSWDWQLIGVLAATSAEAAFQQMIPHLPVTQLLNTLLSSAKLRIYLADLAGHPSSSGQPQTVPATTGTPMTAPPGTTTPPAGTNQAMTSEPSADPAQKPQAVPKNDPAS